MDGWIDGWTNEWKEEENKGMMIAVTHFECMWTDAGRGELVLPEVDPFQVRDAIECFCWDASYGIPSKGQCSHSVTEVIRRKISLMGFTATLIRTV